MNVRVHYQIGIGGAEGMLKIGTLEMRQHSISLSGDSLCWPIFTEIAKDVLVNLLKKCHDTVAAHNIQLLTALNGHVFSVERFVWDCGLRF